MIASTDSEIIKQNYQTNVVKHSSSLFDFSIIKMLCAHKTFHDKCHLYKLNNDQIKWSFFLIKSIILFFKNLITGTYCRKSYTILKAFQFENMKTLRPFVHFPSAVITF